MTATLELVQRIEAALATADETRTEQLRELAERVEYATTRLAEKVNKCEALWRQARFEEARQAARKGGEDLREQAPLATFRDADSWSSWCRRVGAPIPVPVDAAKLRFVLEQLNAGPSKLEQLLREFRRMVLGRAPLIDRLRMLRILAKADPENSGWLDDVRAFESVRHDELARAVRDAERRADLVQLRALKVELATDPWLMPPPPRLLPSVEAALGPLETRAAEQRYETLAEELRGAHGSLDEARSRKLLEEWDALAAATKVQAPPSCANEPQPVRTWLKDQDDQRSADRTFESACAALENALDGGGSLEDIERLASAVLRLERGMPQVLGTRTASRMEELRARGRARYALKLAGVLAGVALVGGIVAASWNYQTRATNVARWAGQLNATLSSDDLASARRLLDELQRSDVEAYQAPEVQDLAAKVLTREQAERERSTAFSASIASLEGAGPGHVDFDALLKRSESLAKLDVDRALVEEWRHRRAVHLDEQQRYRDQQLAPGFEKLARDYEALREASARDSADVQDRAAACLELARRLAASGDASPRMRERAQAVVSGTEALLQQSLSRNERQQQIAQALERLQRTVEVDELAAALTAFSRSFPDHPRSTDFVKAAASAETWRAINAWRTLMIGMGTSIRAESSTMAAERKRSLDAYVKAYPKSPHRADAQRLLSYYSHAQRALEASGVIGLDVVRSVLDSPLMAASFVVEDREGRRHYLLDDRLPQQPQRPGSPAIYSFDFVVNARGGMRKKVWNTQIQGIDAVARRSPQSRFVEAALRLLGSPRDGLWETIYPKLIELVVSNDEMDPILATSLIRLFAEHGKAAVPVGAEDLEQFERELRNIRVEVAWMDPDNEDAPPIRNSARGAMSRLPAVRPLVQKIEEHLRAPIALWPTGILLREIHPAEGGATQGDIYVATGNEPALRRVGKFVNGVPQVESSSLNEVPQGSLVFATNDSGEGR